MALSIWRAAQSLPEDVARVRRLEALGCALISARHQAEDVMMNGGTFGDCLREAAAYLEREAARELADGQ